MTTSPLPVSADSHVNEPHNLWYDRLPSSLRSSAPRYLEPDTNGTYQLVINDDPVGWKHVLPAQAQHLDQERLDLATPEARYAMMVEDGIGGEMVYPTIGLYLWDIADGVVGSASCRIYNEWIEERLGGHGDRIKMAAMIPTWDVGTAVAEVERAAEHGFASAMLPLTGTPPWNHPQWEPLWDALDATGLPATMHQGTGNRGGIVYRGPGSASSNLLTAQTQAHRTVALLTASGVLERHPDLHVVLVETNGGWLAWAMQLLDEFAGVGGGISWANPKLRERPSHYIRNQVHCTFQNDPVALANVPITGAQTLLWGNDYPHPEGTHPHSQSVISELFQGLSDADRERILTRNTVEIFGFDADVVSQPVTAGASA